MSASITSWSRENMDSFDMIAYNNEIKKKLLEFKLLLKELHNKEKINKFSINNDINTKIGGKSKNFFINKGVTILFSITWIIYKATTTYAAKNQELDAPTNKSANKAVTSGPMKGTRVNTPEIKERINAYLIPNKKNTIKEAIPTNMQARILAPNQPETWN